jgi:hypothetical protein
VDIARGALPADAGGWHDLVYHVRSRQSSQRPLLF